MTWILTNPVSVSLYSRVDSILQFTRILNAVFRAMKAVTAILFHTAFTTTGIALGYLLTIAQQPKEKISVDDNTIMWALILCGVTAVTSLCTSIGLNINQDRIPRDFRLPIICGIFALIPTTTAFLTSLYPLGISQFQNVVMFTFLFDFAFTVGTNVPPPCNICPPALPRPATSPSG